MLYKVSEDKKPNILDYLIDKKIRMVVNIVNTNGTADSKIYEDEYTIRRKAVELGIPVITNLELASHIVKVL
jgi:carbamoyl-phosphate synthase large subunit